LSGVDFYTTISFEYIPKINLSQLTIHLITSTNHCFAFPIFSLRPDYTSPNKSNLLIEVVFGNSHLGCVSLSPIPLAPVRAGEQKTYFQTHSSPLGDTPFENTPLGCTRDRQDRQHKSGPCHPL